MRKVIENKTYDTETAECLYTWQSTADMQDFHYSEKSLYVTKQGAYFASGQSSRQFFLDALTEDQAFEFLQDHSKEKDAYEAIEKYFADRIQPA